MSRATVALVLVVFFVVSIFTNTLGALLPDIIGTFALSLTAAGLLPFAFFAAYGVASIPAGLLTERTSEKQVMVGAFALALVSSLAFALVPRYPVAIASLFVTGVAMAAVQVAAQPLLRVAGGEARFAFFSTLGQLAFGAASFVSPRIYTALTLRSLPWTSLYWLFAALAAVLVVVLSVAKLPRVERKDDERAGSLDAHRALLRGGAARWFASIFLYVGIEQGISSWLSQFLATYHGVDPRTGGANAVSWFWGLMTLGCVSGLVVLKVFDSRKVLVVHAVLAIVLFAIGLFGPTPIAILALPAVGLVASVMWPIIFALALNSVRSHQGTLSGILCTAIVGGAVVPLVIGRVGDRLGLRAGMTLLFLNLGWILAIGFWAKPVVKER
ncbi:MAG: MFS transporter [Labilithrix sp.]|nr:MFS transporter [Labilithrix sp.]MCW5814619.1 MFS transporter [Labilithrix sp.]